MTSPDEGPIGSSASEQPILSRRDQIDLPPEIRFLAQQHQHTERGAALVLVAHLDESVASSIKARLLDDPEVKEPIDDPVSKRANVQRNAAARLVWSANPDGVSHGNLRARDIQRPDSYFQNKK